MMSGLAQRKGSQWVEVGVLSLLSGPGVGVREEQERWGAVTYSGGEPQGGSLGITCADTFFHV